MKEALSFDDVLIVPKFSFISSRKDVSLSSEILGQRYNFPIMSSNMDTVTGVDLAVELLKAGGLPVLHRFQSIENNIKDFLLVKNASNKAPAVSVGVAPQEIERALALVQAGATQLVIDVAHGAALHVVQAYDSIRYSIPDNVYIAVGNFATKEGIQDFKFHVKSSRKPDMYKCNIGGGSLCTTRITTGCGYPAFESLIDCALSGERIINDGGMKNSGDMAKALAAGAHCLMMGKPFAATKEAPGEIITDSNTGKKLKKYRGSASLESYNVQGKIAEHRAPEGESSFIEIKGSVSELMQNINGGLRSALTYTGASSLEEFRKVASFVRITHGGNVESQPHGKER